jgi:hypothetical protein
MAEVDVMRQFDVTTPPHLAGAAFEDAVRRDARKLKEELIRQTLEDASSWSRSVEDRWANEHPGEAPIFVIPHEEVEQYRERVRTEDFEWIIPSFERYLLPDPDQFNPVIDSLRHVEAMFEGRRDAEGEWVGAGGELGRTASIRTDMDEWAGKFKDGFIDSFITPLEGTLPNHGELARIVGEQLKLTKVIYLRQRQSVLDLLGNGIKATQALSNGACSAEDACKWASIALVVIGTVAGALAPGWGVLSAAVFLEASGTIGGGLVPEAKEEQKMPLAAPTATEVASNIANAMSRLNNDISFMEESAADALRELYRVAEIHRMKAVAENASGPFSVAVPELAYATPAQITVGLKPDE